MDRSIEFLRRHDPTKPFFQMMSFVRPHSPLDPPQHYYDMYMNMEIPAPIVGDWADSIDAEGNGQVYNCSSGKVEERALKRARAAYYRMHYPH